MTSNRDSVECVALMADRLLAQSAIDRLQSTAHGLVLEGDSYRRRQKRGLDLIDEPERPRRRRRPRPRPAAATIITAPTT